MEKTASAGRGIGAPDVETPVGNVVQVYSLFVEVEQEGIGYLRVRKPLLVYEPHRRRPGPLPRHRHERDEVARRRSSSRFCRENGWTRPTFLKIRSGSGLLFTVKQMLIVTSLKEPGSRKSSTA
jgi:hypothetical protein